MFETWERVLKVPNFWKKYKSFIFRLNKETDGIYDYIEIFINTYEPLFKKMIKIKFGIDI